jgi:hypothetical protein
MTGRLETAREAGADAASREAKYRRFISPLRKEAPRRAGSAKPKRGRTDRVRLGVPAGGASFSRLQPDVPS